MGEQDDKVFMKRFSGILAGLVIVTILIIIISVGSDRLEPGENPSRAILAAERVAPVGAVRTELPAPEILVEDAVAEESSPEPAEEPASPDDSAGSFDGAAVYASACSACHAAGVAGAPIPGSDTWAERAANGVDSLVANAIAGVGPIMQPKGGRADLSDEEIKAIVEHMMTL
jgi:cytochrome c5